MRSASSAAFSLGELLAPSDRAHRWRAALRHAGEALRSPLAPAGPRVDDAKLDEIKKALAATLAGLPPQPGPQEEFLGTCADIGIYGGSVYGGKTWGLVRQPLEHVANPGFTFVNFRRTKPEIRNPGGMWDESLSIYPRAGGEDRETTLDWFFPSGARGKFDGLQYDADVLAWKGAQICALLFDQLEEFTEKQFFYMLSRNRSTCGIKPYTRATVNPDPDSFLATFLAWWIDQESGYAILERSGCVRWFIRVDDTIVWSETVAPAGTRGDAYRAYEQQAQAELEATSPGQGKDALGVTFILARLRDNKIGVEKDPQYEGRVRAMGYVERERLLGSEDRGGNWKVRPSAGKVFPRDKVGFVPVMPAGLRTVRYWDKAGTDGGGKFTAGVRMGVQDGVIYVVDVQREQLSSKRRNDLMKATAQLDGPDVEIWVEQEPGSGGKESAEISVQLLAGYAVHTERVTGEKHTRAAPFASQWQGGNVRLVVGDWNKEYLDEMAAQPGSPFKDQMDASSGAYNKLALTQEWTTSHFSI
ncbi:MAG TPA: terminase family protein [Candidatus Limnocylindria bacterium]|nr:terminase family protein [Candidatus Limnocylindria bacterium]